MIKTAMILDDEVQVLSALRRVLVRAGWHVVTFSNPLDALQHLRHSFVPVIITDFRMPCLSGEKFLQLVEEMQPATYKIMLSAHARREDIVNTISSAGVHRFMSKPWRNDQLLQEMEAGLEYFELMLKAEYEQNKATMTNDEFRVWYESLLARMQCTGAQGRHDRQAWLES